MVLPGRRTRPSSHTIKIIFQAKSSDKGGGLGALTTLARAVEQGERREELSLQLVKETKALDVLGAEVGKHVPKHVYIPVYFNVLVS